MTTVTEVRSGSQPKRTPESEAAKKAQTDRERWARTHTASVRKNGADGRAGV
jgi:hypothetical protein